MADSDTVKALLYVCLACIGILITITVFFIYTLVFRVNRRFTYHFSFADTNANSHATENKPSTGNYRITEIPGTTGHSETTATTEPMEEKDTDSLTRGISFTKFERPEVAKRSDEFAHQETIEDLDTTEHPDIVEHPDATEYPDTTERLDTFEPLGTTEYPNTTTNTDTTDDAKDTDSLKIRGLSFSDFRRLETIEYPMIMKYSETTEHQETTQQPETTENSKSTGHPMKTENLYITGQPETIKQQETTERLCPTFDNKDADSLTLGKPTSDHQQPTHPDSTRLPEPNGINGTTRKEDTIDYTTEDTRSNPDSVSLGLSFRSYQKRDEKRVSFSGNDSTYVVATERKTVQQMTFDGTSNFGFVKFIREQQKKT